MPPGLSPDSLARLHSPQHLSHQCLSLVLSGSLLTPGPVRSAVVLPLPFPSPCSCQGCQQNPRAELSTSFPPGCPSPSFLDGPPVSSHFLPGTSPTSPLGCNQRVHECHVRPSQSLLSATPLLGPPHMLPSPSPSRTRGLGVPISCSIFSPAWLTRHQPPALTQAFLLTPQLPLIPDLSWSCSGPLAWLPNC